MSRRIVGGTKQKVAQMIRDYFEREGVLCNVFDGDFRTADGFWRRVDVYRWQIYVELHESGRWSRVEISSWDTLTKCARSGISITPTAFPWSYEADAVNDKKRMELAALIPKGADHEQR